MSSRERKDFTGEIQRHWNKNEIEALCLRVSVVNPELKGQCSKFNENFVGFLTT